MCKKSRVQTIDDIIYYHSKGYIIQNIPTVSNFLECNSLQQNQCQFNIIHKCVLFLNIEVIWSCSTAILKNHTLTSTRQNACSDWFSMVVIHSQNVYNTALLTSLWQQQISSEIEINRWLIFHSIMHTLAVYSYNITADYLLLYKVNYKTRKW